MEEKKVKILGIACSPRKNGNTVTLVSRALQGASEADRAKIETELITLDSKKNLRRCDGLDDCHIPQWRMCTTQNDDVYPVLGKMIKADGIVIGSPVYNGLISAGLAILAARTNCLITDIETGASLLGAKLGGAIAVGQYPQEEQAEGGGQELVLRTISVLFDSHSMELITPIGGKLGVSACSVTTDPGAVAELDEAAMEEAWNLGRRMALAILERR